VLIAIGESRSKWPGMRGLWHSIVNNMSNDRVGFEELEYQSILSSTAVFCNQ
jgi:hypothetical protein